MKTLTVPAELEQLQNVQDFISGELEAFDCPMKTQFQIEVAVEEIFVNIVSYAYRPEVGEATGRCGHQRRSAGGTRRRTWHPDGEKKHGRCAVRLREWKEHFDHP